MNAQAIKNSCFIFIMTLVAMQVSAGEKIIRVAADEWCPYNCSPDNKDRPGYIIEIAQAVFSKAGYRVEYSIMPYQRALDEVLAGHIEGVVGLDPGSQTTAEADFLKAHGKEKHFVMPKKIGVSKVVFYAPADSKWQYDPAKPDESLNALGGKVGIAQGYSFEITPLLQKHQLVTEVGGDTPMQQLLKMLDKGRISAVIDDDKVIQSVADNIGLSSRFKAVGLAGKPLDLYIGFAPEQQVLADILNKGIDEMRQSGELKKLLKKYNLEDWQ